MIRLFQPIMAGATLPDRLVASAGALAGIGLTGLACGLAFGAGPHVPLLVAPMGASAVLLFAVPSSPLAQPWSIIGGNTLSALVGVAVARLVPEPAAAAALAVAAAIALMSLTRCLHPPGGAAALTAVLGGPAVTGAGFLFPFLPVGLNSLILVGAGWLFHRAYRRHSYPHRAPPAPVNRHGTADPPASARVGFRPEDVDAALADLGEAFDIDRDDLDQLLQKVELRAFSRAHGDLVCADIMSRHVIHIGADAPPAEARRLLIDHGIRMLPVVEAENRVVGTVGLRDLLRPGARVRDVMAPPASVAPDCPAFSLIGLLTDGQVHAVPIVDADRRLLGIVTQTDLLATLWRSR